MDKYRRCGLYQPSMKSKMAIFAWAWLSKRRRSSSSHSSVAKKLSHMALSKQSPSEPMEDRMPPPCGTSRAYARFSSSAWPEPCPPPASACKNELHRTVVGRQGRDLPVLQDCRAAILTGVLVVGEAGDALLLLRAMKAGLYPSRSKTTVKRWRSGSATVPQGFALAAHRVRGAG